MEVIEKVKKTMQAEGQQVGVRIFLSGCEPDLMRAREGERFASVCGEKRAAVEDGKKNPPAGYVPTHLARLGTSHSGTWPNEHCITYALGYAFL